MDPIISEKQAVIIRHSSGLYIKIQSDANSNYRFWQFVKRTAIPYDFKKLDIAVSRFNAVRKEAQSIVDQNIKSRAAIIDVDNRCYHDNDIKKYNWWLTNEFEIIECKIITIIEPKEQP